MIGYLIAILVAVCLIGYVAYRGLKRSPPRSPKAYEAGYTCPKGHPMDPSWTSCPRCDAESRGCARMPTTLGGGSIADAGPRSEGSATRVGSKANENESRSRRSMFDLVDEALARMKLASIAFNSPDPINIDESAKVELRLDLQLPAPELVKLITARGVVEHAQVKVSHLMTAHLSGPDFDITANTPETQAVSGNESTIWLWTVKPKIVADCDLCLDLNATITIDGDPTARTIKTFSKTIHVTVRPAQQVARFVKAHWKWLCGSILIPIAGWWLKQRL